MTTQFIVIEIPFQLSVQQLEQAIAQSLQTYGEPLRWAITGVDCDRQVFQIEAVVTLETATV